MLTSLLCFNVRDTNAQLLHKAVVYEFIGLSLDITSTSSLDFLTRLEDTITEGRTRRTGKTRCQRQTLQQQ